MSITYKIPHKTRFLPAQCVQEMKFDVVSNTYEITESIKSLFSIQKNTVYLIERVSFSATVPEDNYLRLLDYDSATGRSLLPMIDLVKKKNGTSIFNDKLALCNFKKESDISSWVFGDDGDDELLVKFSGHLLSSSDTVGYMVIDLFLNFNIFCIDQNSYNENFRSELSQNYGSSLRF